MTHRRAATLIELLVVMAIIAVLTGLVLSATLQVRATADSASCRNRSRQLALAGQMFHEQHRQFPPGVGKGDTAKDKWRFMTWEARLLPELGETALWNQIVSAFQMDPDFRSDSVHTDKSRVLGLFVCPSDPRAGGPSRKVEPANGLTSFLGVLGTDQFRTNGVLFIGSRVSFEQITDGTSHTLFAGERPPSADERLGWWYAGWGQGKTGSADSVLGVRSANVPSNINDTGCPFGPYRFTSGKLDSQCDAFHFWSLHPGGAHFAFCDGSVRFLSYSADPIMPAIATRAGGEAVATP